MRATNKLKIRTKITIMDYYFFKKKKVLLKQTLFKHENLQSFQCVLYNVCSIYLIIK